MYFIHIIKLENPPKTMTWDYIHWNNKIQLQWKIKMSNINKEKFKYFKYVHELTSNGRVSHIW